MVSPDWQRRIDRSRLAGVAGWSVTMLAVIVAWVFFRAATFEGAGADHQRPQLFPVHADPERSVENPLLWNVGLHAATGFAWCTPLLIIAALAPNSNQIGTWTLSLCRSRSALRALIGGAACAMITLLVLLNTARDTISAFIYFKLLMRTVTLFLTGVGVVLCALEVALRVLPSPTATRDNRPSLDPVVLTYPANHEWMTASGWDLRNSLSDEKQQLRLRDAAAIQHYLTAVALIGDSFVEASSLREDEGPAPQLESLLNERPVYAMGVPGSNLLDYAERVRFAAVRFSKSGISCSYLKGATFGNHCAAIPMSLPLAWTAQRCSRAS